MAKAHLFASVDGALATLALLSFQGSRVALERASFAASAFPGIAAVGVAVLKAGRSSVARSNPP
jgi:hypothetical protein